MLVTLGTYRAYNTKIQLLLAAGPQFGLKIGGGGGGWQGSPGSATAGAFTILLTLYSEIQLW